MALSLATVFPTRLKALYMGFNLASLNDEMLINISTGVTHLTKLECFVLDISDNLLTA